MTFIRATRTTGAPVLINLNDIAAMEPQEAGTRHDTAMILHKGREIEVTESLDDLLHQAAAQMVPGEQHRPTIAQVMHRHGGSYGWPAMRREF